MLQRVLAANTEVLGRVNESQLSAFLVRIEFSNTRAVYRLDRSGGSLNIINDTNNATSGTTDAF